ncbi:ran-binding protein 3 [Glossina fuscipes]|uniref:Ran-binding protein 3 n=1 Tax=Glossina fuscipes TaxID=7396 RepID=A0A8U0WID2_9MUSC|nr:ran-binding protein 3 [Glossina fuscipes]
MSETNDNSNESNSMGSDTIVQTSRLVNVSGSGTTVNNPIVRTGVLRPSVLGPSRLTSSLSTNNTNAAPAIADSGDDGTESNKVKDAVKANPFLKEHKADDEETVAETSSAINKKKDDKNKGDTSSDDTEDHPDPMSLLRKNGFERANLFAAAKNSIPLVEKSGFVFGQNVHERVVGENVKPENSNKPENAEPAGSSGGELLFSSVIQSAAAKTADKNGASALDNAETKSLNDVAREYEESRAQKRKFEEVETFTGEENEVNIIDVNCKLFAFMNSNWEERGRGSLRLNDSKKEQECSRLVFRTSGNLRLLLNTKVWGGMVAERPSQKSLRLTAMDNTGKIKIFLIMARPVEINQLHTALVQRIRKRKASHPEEFCADNSNNSADNNVDSETEMESKNGAEKDVAEKAALVAEPEPDDSTEPSPKKTLSAVSEEATNIETNN